MTAVVCAIILFTRFVKCFFSFAVVLGRENVICELIKVRYKSVSWEGECQYFVRKIVC